MTYLDPDPLTVVEPEPEPPSPRFDRFIVALSALTAILVIGAVWKMVTG